MGFYMKREHWHYVTGTKMVVHATCIAYDNNRYQKLFIANI